MLDNDGRFGVRSFRYHGLVGSSQPTNPSERPLYLARFSQDFLLFLAVERIFLVFRIVSKFFSPNYVETCFVLVRWYYHVVGNATLDCRASCWH